MKNFIVKIFGVSAILALLGWIVFSYLIPQYYLPVFPVMLLFFMVVAFIVHAWQLSLARKGMAKFARISMIITFLKLVAYSTFAIIYIATNPDNALPFVVALMVLYLVYTFIEIRDLMHMTKKKQP